VAAARITERDRALLELAAEHRLILSTHAQVLLGVARATAEERLRALRYRGLLTREATFDGQPSSYQITRAGLNAIASELPRPRPNLAEYAHDVGVGWLWLAVKAGRLGPLRAVVSEREMRSADGSGARDGEPFGVRLGGVGPGGRPRLHYPDLLLETESGHRVAVELELTTKGRARRERILSGYGADPRIDAVVYFVCDPRVGRAIESSAARLRLSSLVHVQRFEWGALPPPAAGGVARQREPARARSLTSEAVR
jgi:hypothetical protein